MSETQQPQQTSIDEQIEQAMKDMATAREHLAALREQRQPEDVEDYVLLGSDGAEVRLSELFGEHDDLMVVHNMGRGCSYCTLWADGFIGLLPHLENRAAFVISSPDDPETQAAFAGSRGWPFHLVSTKDSSFTRDMGFLDDESGYWPGVSTFRRGENGQLQRVGKDFFGPGDDYCSVWHLFDLLADGPAGWQPRFTYDD